MGVWVYGCMGVWVEEWTGERVEGWESGRGIERPTFNVQHPTSNQRNIEYRKSQYRMQEELNIQHSTFNIQHRIKEILDT